MFHFPNGQTGRSGRPDHLAAAAVGAPATAAPTWLGTLARLGRRTGTSAFSTAAPDDADQPRSTVPEVVRAGAPLFGLTVGGADKARSIGWKLRTMGPIGARGAIGARGGTSRDFPRAQTLRTPVAGKTIARADLSLAGWAGWRAYA